MPSTEERLIGAQFDTLDKAVAARARDLMSRGTISKQTYDEWITDLTQLSSFANQYSGVSYVNKQWSAEIPRYQQIDSVISSKVVIANPSNYDTRLPISGGRVSGCGCNDMASVPPYTPGNYGTGGLAGGGFFGGDTVLNQSIGDGLRATPIPYNPPAPLVDKSEIVTQLIIAALIGVALFGFHYFTKKKL